MAPEPAPRRRLRWKIVAAVLILTPALVVAGLFVMTRQAPDHVRDYHRFLARTTAQQRAEMSLGFWRRFGQAVRQSTQKGSGLVQTEPHTTLERTLRLGGQVRPSGARHPLAGFDGWPAPGEQVRIELTVSRDELRSLIAENAEGWIRQKGHSIPPEVSDPMVDFVDGEWVGFCTLKVRDYSQVVSGYFHVDFKPRGAAGHMTGFTAGELPLPFSEIGQFVADKLGDPDKARVVDRAVQKVRGFEVQPSVNIEGHTVTLQSVVADEEAGSFIIAANVLGGAEPMARRWSDR